MSFNPVVNTDYRNKVTYKEDLAFDWHNKDSQLTYTYYGFSNSGKWKLKRKINVSMVWGTAEGTGDYATAWADRENKEYT